MNGVCAVLSVEVETCPVPEESCKWRSTVVSPAKAPPLTIVPATHIFAQVS